MEGIRLLFSPLSAPKKTPYVDVLSKSVEQVKEAILDF
jgi:hypothetical protein